MCQLDIHNTAEAKAIQYQGNVKAKTIVYQLKVYRMAFCLLCLETDGTLRGDCVPLTITNLPEPYFLNHLFPWVFKTSLRRNQNNSGLIGCVETVLGETLNSKAKSTNDRGDFFWEQLSHKNLLCFSWDFVKMQTDRHSNKVMFLTFIESLVCTGSTLIDLNLKILLGNYTFDIISGLNSYLSSLISFKHPSYKSLLLKFHIVINNLQKWQ